MSSLLAVGGGGGEGGYTGLRLIQLNSKFFRHLWSSGVDILVCVCILYMCSP